MALRYLVEDSTEVSWYRQQPTMIIVAPPGHTAVLATTIEAAYDDKILLYGTWDGTTYTPPAGYVAPFDPGTDQGAVKQAAHDTLDVFDAAIGLMLGNPQAWPAANVQNALSGIYWQSVAMARVCLNSTRTAARRQKFCEECASWPTIIERRSPPVRGWDGQRADPISMRSGHGSTRKTDPFDSKVYY